MTISAKVIADSIANNIRLTTMELTYHRFIHSEFMTHRMFSRNAASSRAIPVEKMLKQVEENPAMPIHWGKNQPGMQAREETHHIGLAINYWETAADDAAWKAQCMISDCELHKQVANRILEPFQYIKVIVTATEWDNFFKLRNHPDAQPEIAFLAAKMQEAMGNSTPKELRNWEYHLPYVSDEEYNNLLLKDYKTEDAIKCSVARCARVSYLNHDASVPDVSKDIALYDRLLEAGHMSPFEHIAAPMQALTWIERFKWEKGITHMDRDTNYWSGNFRGWIQHRQLLAATR